jgi:hypothetical protein
MYKSNQQIEVQSSIENITSITVYDLGGRVLFVANGIHDKNYTIAALSVAQQALIVKITLDNGEIITKKLL